MTFDLRSTRRSPPAYRRRAEPRTCRAHPEPADAFDVEQQGGRELLCAASRRIINARMPALKLPEILSQARRRPQGCALTVRLRMSTARRALRTSRICRDNRKRNLASYPLVCVWEAGKPARQRWILFKPVTCASDELRRAAGGSSASRFGFDEFS